jgi:hypothetical protein
MELEGLARIYHELLSRDHETGNPLAGLSGAERARISWTCLPAIASLLAQAKRAGHLVTAGCWFRGVPLWYVAGTACPERSRRNTRGRQEGRTYPRSQRVIHEISGLCLKYDLKRSGSFFVVKRCYHIMHLLASQLMITGRTLPL